MPLPRNKLLKKIYAKPWVLQYGLDGWRLFHCSTHDKPIAYLPLPEERATGGEGPNYCDVGDKWAESCTIVPITEAPTEFLERLANAPV